MSLVMVEDNLIALAKNTFSQKVKTIDILPGQWTVETLKQIATKAPAIYFAWLGGRGKGNSSDAMLNDVWVAYVIANHASGFAAQRRGDSKQIGCAEMLDTIIPTVHGYKIDDVGTFKFQRAQNLFNFRDGKSKGITVFAATFEMQRTLPFTVDLSTFDNFETYHAEHSMAPGDDEPAAIDDVTLPQ